MFSLGWDPQSLKEIAQLAGAAVLLDEKVQEAMKQIGDLIVGQTHDNALSRFRTNSPGGLAESFYVVTESLYELQVGSQKPHAHRRDQGFYGTDSRGRQYHDPPYLFFTDAVTGIEVSGQGMELLQEALMHILPGGF